MQEEKYKTKPIRRVAVIGYKGTALDTDDQRTKTLLEGLKTYGKFDKKYWLKDGFEGFQEKYPFLCLNLENKLQTEELTKKDKKILTENEEKWLYSFSRFPTEILEGTLFIGNTSNSNSKKQLNDLGIKSIFEFTYLEDQNIPEFKKKDFNYKNILANKETIGFFDLDELMTEVTGILSNPEKTPLLICCKVALAI